MTPEQLSRLLKHPTLRGYRPLSRGSSGNMGTVIKALSPSGITVAIKLVELDSEHSWARFGAEVEALRRLDTPHITRLHQAHALSDSEACLIMDWVEGESLKDRIQTSFSESLEGPPSDWIRARFLELCSALQAAHQAGLLHRDIKPANIMISQPANRSIESSEGYELDVEHAVLVDFGIVKLMNKGLELSLTKTGEMLGTPSYMAPEQLDAKGEFGLMTPATDIWGLGATLYFCLTGQEPFPGESLTQVVQGILEKRPLAPQKLVPQTPTELASLCLACLSKKPAQRPSLDELRERLLDPAKSSKAPRAKVAALSIFVLVLALASLYAWINLSPPKVLELSLDPPEALTTAKNLVLRGRLNKSASITIDEIKIQTEPSGQFEYTRRLEEGENLITLRLGEGLPQQSWKVVADHSGPELKVLHPHQKIPDSEDPNYRAYSIDADLNLRIQASDPALIKGLSVNGQTLVANGNQYVFHCADLDTKTQRFKVEAVDQLGNKTQVQFDAFADPHARIKKKAAEVLAFEREQTLLLSPRDFSLAKERELQRLGPELAATLDINTWREASSKTRLDCVYLIALRGNGRYSVQELKKSPSKTQDFEIGVLRHEATGLELHLIPGGRIAVPIWLKPGASAIFSIMRLVALEGLTRANFRSILRWFPEAIRNPFQRRHEVGDPKLENLQAELAALIKQAPSEFDPRYADWLEQRDNLNEYYLEAAERDASIMVHYAFDRDPRTRGLLELDFLKNTESIVEPQLRWVEVYVPPCLMAATELPIGAWEKFGGRKLPRSGPAQPEDLLVPALGINAQESLAWLARFPELRLPSAEEWRQACLAGRNARRYFGDEDPELIAHFIAPQVIDTTKLRPPSNRADKANELGLIDMLGYGEEWISLPERAWQRLVETGVPRPDAAAQNHRRMATGGSLRYPPELCTAETYAEWLPEENQHPTTLRLCASVPGRLD